MQIGFAAAYSDVLYPKNTLSCLNNIYKIMLRRSVRIRFICESKKWRTTSCCRHKRGIFVREKHHRRGIEMVHLNKFGREVITFVWATFSVSCLHDALGSCGKFIHWSAHSVWLNLRSRRKYMAYMYSPNIFFLCGNYVLLLYVVCFVDKLRAECDMSQFGDSERNKRKQLNIGVRLEVNRGELWIMGKREWEHNNNLNYA